jgi:uncharacterized protein (TIGR00269 family)
MKGLEEKVKRTIKRFNLLKKSDKVIVACSGGKDSTTALYLLHKFGYNVEALFIDLGIKGSSSENLKNLKTICNKFGIKLNVVRLEDETGRNLVQVHKRVEGSLTTCAVCGIIKRYYLNKKARELRADKLVTGHNLDDEAENILLNVFGGNLSVSLGLGPISGLVKNTKFVPRVKPLYFCSNEETKRFTEIKRFKTVYCMCPLSTLAFRRQVRRIIAELEKDEPSIKLNIVNQFLDLLPILRKKYQKGKRVTYCVCCAEPSRSEVCKKCELLKG